MLGIDWLADASSSFIIHINGVSVMLLIVGGAYSGKRSVARQILKRIDSNLSHSDWISAYESHALPAVQTFNPSIPAIVIEGWEQWLKQSLDEVKSLEAIRASYKQVLNAYKQWGHEHISTEMVLIMLEMGRGIVPIDANERSWRDLNGWLVQDAAAAADEVFYVWNGLSQVLKQRAVK
jgi:adenosylcobinamide kinase/adenosylcobinamide-phosphate guanylyltransferase